MITQNGFRIYELTKRQNFNDKCNGAKNGKKCTNGKDKRSETEKKRGLECGERIRNDKYGIVKAGKNLSLRFLPLLLLRTPLSSRPSKTKQ